MGFRNHPNFPVGSQTSAIPVRKVNPFADTQALPSVVKINRALFHLRTSMYMHCQSPSQQGIRSRIGRSAIRGMSPTACARTLKYHEPPHRRSSAKRHCLAACTGKTLSVTIISGATPHDVGETPQSCVILASSISPPRLWWQNTTLKRIDATQITLRGAARGKNT